jgi:CO dehydrogenase maturation factor
MKMAVSGKGGVGKTTVAAFFIKALAEDGFRVLAIDADPDANLAHALGLGSNISITPISQMKELIEERTETKLGGFGGFFKLNPKVDDLPDSLGLKVMENVRLLVMGGVKKGGSGCVCPESTLLKNLVMHIVLQRNEAVVMDMEAGLEHLGRGTAGAVDLLLVVVEPGKRSIDTAREIKRLAGDIGIKNLKVIGNKVRNPEEEAFLTQELKDFEVLGFIPYSNEIAKADLVSKAPFVLDENGLAIIKDMLEQIRQTKK